MWMIFLVVLDSKYADSSHASSSRECTRSSSTSTPCCVATTSPPTCGCSSASWNRVFRSRPRDRGWGILDKGCVRSPKRSTTVSIYDYHNTGMAPLVCSGSILTRMSLHHHHLLIEFVQPQLLEYDISMHSFDNQLKLQGHIIIPSASFCFARRYDSEIGASGKSTQKAFIFNPYRKLAKLSLNRVRLSCISCKCIKLASRSAIESASSAN